MDPNSSPTPDQQAPLLNRCPNAPVIINYHWSNAPTLTPAPSRQQRLAMFVTIWYDSPSVVSTGFILKRCKIVNLITMSSIANDV
jgi:hypothetical protein